MTTALSRPDGLPAILGGSPAFPEGLALVRPMVGDPDALAEELRGILTGGVLTNGPRVRELERRAAEYLGVRHCVAVASCTSGLMLVLRAADLSGDVVVPSFTFAATVHAVAWNGLRPVFADVDPSTLTLSPEAVRRAVGVRTSAILATHTFGTPCDVEGLTAAAREAGIRLFFDAAHAFGSSRAGVPVGGFGDAEVFSLSPTKVLVAGEGGIVATNDDVLDERCRIGRDYGNPGDYDCLFVGLNARMSELHAALALASLDGLDERVRRRNQLAGLYRETLGPIPGIGFPSVDEAGLSTYKDLTILVEPEDFGMDANTLSGALAEEGVETRRYYAPPVHAMRAYRHLKGTNGHLPVTDWAAARVVTLPLWSDMTEDQVMRVAAAVARIRVRRDQLPPPQARKTAPSERRKDTPPGP
jgi:dTDP-4-amino-4,6-dideoxygalactose transaminase